MTRHLIFAIVFVISTSTSWTQTAGTGAITGTVEDMSGAVVQNAQVVVVSEASGAKRTVTTASDGVYRVPLLPPGSYRIQASANGFKLAVQSSVPVAVTEITSLNIKLEIGSQTETVTVQTSPEMTQMDSNALGHVTDERSVTGLPLASRNFTQIIGLSPGANVGLTDATELGTGGGGMAPSGDNEGLSVNGARNNDNKLSVGWCKRLKRPSSQRLSVRGHLRYNAPTPSLSSKWSQDNTTPPTGATPARTST